LHMEIDIAGSGMSYQTGDHIAVWPTNPSAEVDLFLEVLGLAEKRHTVIRIKGLDVTAKVPFPTPTTYDAAFRFYLEICAPVSRQFVASLAAFAPDEKSKAELVRLGNDKDYFHDKIASQCINIAQVLRSLASTPFSSVPFSLLVEGINRIQPRYYSISSSSLVHKDKVGITAVVESIRISSTHVVKGVTTNYLLALKQKQHGEPEDLKYAITGPRKKYDGIHIPVHIRHSNFKLPSDPAKPIIMIGPGTGVAPFRGFIQERAAQAAAGEKIGMTVLFYGCRNRNEDFLYREEWVNYQQKLGDSLQIITAFSRETADKVYVQHRLREHSEMVNDLLKQKANLYVCGDAANMAREVNVVLAQIISHERKLPVAKGEEIVKHMRSSGAYQEDVWS